MLGVEITPCVSESTLLPLISLLYSWFTTLSILNCFFYVIGDLTDAKDESFLGSSQYLNEWLEYNQTVEYCMARYGSSLKWLDVRGNHGKKSTSWISFSNLIFKYEYGIKGKMIFYCIRFFAKPRLTEEKKWLS